MNKKYEVPQINMTGKSPLTDRRTLSDVKNKHTISTERSTLQISPFPKILNTQVTNSHKFSSLEKKSSMNKCDTIIVETELFSKEGKIITKKLYLPRNHNLTKLKSSRAIKRSISSTTTDKLPSLDSLHQITKFSPHDPDNKTSPSKRGEDKMQLNAQQLFLYNQIFHKRLMGKKDPGLINNKMNIVYAENEKQFNFLAEKKYFDQLIKGRYSMRNPNKSPYIENKINDVSSKVLFMKAIVDYTYPSIMLKKIIEKTKINRMMAKEHNKNKTKYITPYMLVDKNNKERVSKQTDYLAKSICVLHKSKSMPLIEAK